MGEKKKLWCPARSVREKKKVRKERSGGAWERKRSRGAPLGVCERRKSEKKEVWRGMGERKKL